MKDVITDQQLSEWQGDLIKDLQSCLDSAIQERDRLERSRISWIAEKRNMQAVIANQRVQLRSLLLNTAESAARRMRETEEWSGRVERLKAKCRRLGLKLAESRRRLINNGVSTW